MPPTLGMDFNILRKLEKLFKELSPNFLRAHPLCRGKFGNN